MTSSKPTASSPPATSAPPPAADAVRRELLLAAVGDLGRSVSSNDQKSSAALVVHGLLFAGIVSIAGSLGDTYDAARDGDQLLMILFLAVALGCFCISVFFLLWAIRPYHPPAELYRSDADYPGVFFPRVDGDATADEQLRTMRERVGAITADTAVNELSIEVLKLADILHHESRRTTRGYTWLGIELLAVLGFLVVAAVNAT